LRLLKVLATGAILGLGTSGPALASNRQDPPAPAAPTPVVPIPAVPQPDGPPDLIPDPLATPGPDPIPRPIPGPPEPVPDPVPAPGPEPVPGPVPGPGADPTLGAVADPPAEPATDPAEADEELPLTPEVTTATQSDGGNLNTSVRVESPGEDAPVTQQNAPSDVISPLTEPDITPDPAATNTNVSVRVSSPGDNGAVTQSTTPANGAPGPPAPGEPGEHDGTGSLGAVEEAASPGADPTQYHDPNSQYQSDSNTPDTSAAESDTEPWNWTWTLTVCDGNTDSISDETGSRNSRDWVWNWIWNWSCNPTASDGSAPATASTAASGDSANQDRGSGVPQAGPANVNVSIRVLSPGDNGPVTQTNAAPASAPGNERPSEPSWIWLWTFEWCGQTTEISTRAGAGTGLDWLWNWTWTWACEGDDAGNTGPDTGPDTAPTTPDQGATPHPGRGSGQTSVPASTAPAESGSPEDASADNPAGDAVTSPAADADSLLAVLWPWFSWPTAPSWPATAVATSASADHALPYIPVPAVATEIADWLASLPPPSVDVAVEVAVPAVVSKPSQTPTVVIATVAGTIEIEIDVEVGTPAVATSPSLSSPAPQPDAHAPKAARAAAPTSGQASSRTVSIGSMRAPQSQSSIQRSQPTPGASAGTTPRRRGPLPFDLPPLQAASSSASAGGSAPSLLVFGFAAFIGFFVLAAPGLGRRIRLARLPSPRGRYGSSIERPG